MSEDTNAQSAVSAQKPRVTKEQREQMKKKIIELETLLAELENQNTKMMYERIELFSCHARAEDDLQEKEKIYQNYRRDVEHYEQRKESNPDDDAIVYDCQEHIDESQCEMSCYNEETLMPAQEACYKAELELKECDGIIDRIHIELSAVQNELVPLIAKFRRLRRVKKTIETKSN
jgi:hypothetical protein